MYNSILQKIQKSVNHSLQFLMCPFLIREDLLYQKLNIFLISQPERLAPLIYLSSQETKGLLYDILGFQVYNKNFIWGEGGWSNSEICLKCVGGAIKESLLKYLNGRVGKGINFFVRGGRLEGVTTPSLCKIVIVHQVLTHFNSTMFCKLLPK